MATGSFKQYARSIDAYSLYDLVNTHTVKCALVTSSYTPSVTAAAGHYRWHRDLPDLLLVSEVQSVAVHD